MPQVFPRLAVEDDDAAVAVAVGDEYFVVRRVDPDFRRSSHQRRVVTAAGLIELADYQHHFAVARELDGQVALARVGPHEVVVIDEQAVNRAPLAIGSTRIPRLYQLALRIPFGDAALARRPHVAARVGKDANHLAPLEVRRQFEELRVRFELRHRRGLAHTGGVHQENRDYAQGSFQHGGRAYTQVVGS